MITADVLIDDALCRTSQQQSGNTGAQSERGQSARAGGGRAGADPPARLQR